MSTITIPTKELKAAVKESMREVLAQELMKLRALALPYISSREQKDIGKRYDFPSRKIAKSAEFEI